MKIKSFVILLSVVSFFSFFTSCQKTGATGPAGPSFEGTISGYVDLYDQYGNRTVAGLTGSVVSLDSIGNIIAADTVDANGYYAFPNRFTGSYILSVESPSVSPVYGTIQEPIQYLSNTFVKNISMSAQADFSPASVVVSSNTAIGVDSLTISIAPAAQQRNVIVFVGSDSTVSENNYVYALTVRVNANTQNVYAVIPANTLYGLGFPSGSRVFYAIYGSPVNDKSIYLNDATGQNIYTALSTNFLTANTVAP